MTAHESPDPFALFLELLPDPFITLWTLNATYPVVQTGTLLTVASWLEKVDFVRTLLGETRDDADTTFSGLRDWIDVDGTDVRGGTGLMYAAVSGHIEIAQLLVSASVIQTIKATQRLTIAFHPLASAESRRSPRSDGKGRSLSHLACGRSPSDDLAVRGCATQNASSGAQGAPCFSLPWPASMD